MSSISFGQTDISQTVNTATNINPPKTHAGIYTGTVFGVLGSLLSCGADSFAKSTGTITRSNLPLNIALTLGINIGIGALIDHIRNKRLAKFSQETAGMTAFKAVEKDEAAELTPKGNPYVKVATGKKYGTLSFAVLTPLLFALRNKGLPSALMAGILAVNGAISGLIFGAITDYFSNKTIRKVADANPYPKAEEITKK